MQLQEDLLEVKGRSRVHLKADWLQKQSTGLLIHWRLHTDGNLRKATKIEALRWIVDILYHKITIMIAISSITKYVTPLTYTTVFSMTKMI